MPDRLTDRLKQIEEERAALDTEAKTLQERLNQPWPKILTLPFFSGRETLAEQLVEAGLDAPQVDTLLITLGQAQITMQVDQRGTGLLTSIAGQPVEIKV